MQDRLLQELPGCRVNGDLLRRLPGNLNVTFEGVRAESLLLLLDRAGVCASAGSACSTGSPEPSHVLTAMGLDRRRAWETVRFSLGEGNAPTEIDEAVERIKENVLLLRSRKT